MIGSDSRVVAGLIVLSFVGVLRHLAADPQSTQESFEWDLPAGFPIPEVPEDNPMTAEKVELGRHLFFDTRLSVDGSYACASCHQPANAFSDGLGRAVGVTGEIHPRGAMSLANVAYNTTLTWADSNVDSLEDQMLTPMFSEDPVELGLHGLREEVLWGLESVPLYRELFGQAFPRDEAPFTFENLVRAIASFERTLISGNSAYDRYVYWGESEDFSQEARAGMRLFFSHRLKCSECHSGFTFSGPTRYVDGPPPEIAFHNTGLYNKKGTGAYPEDNQGLFEHTGNPEDMGHFRAPTLRNIAMTAPYTHDGTVRTLGELIAHYSNGGRSLHNGVETEIGRDNPYKSEEVTGFDMNATEMHQLLAFLDSLTDQRFLNDPRFQAPRQSH